MTIDLLWERAEPLLFISKEEFVKQYEGWQIEPVHIEGELAFITITKGPAFHFQSMGTKHQITRKMIRDFLQKLIDQYGYATTHAPIEDARQHRFNLLIGFQFEGERGFDRFYRIDRLP